MVPSFRLGTTALKVFANSFVDSINTVNGRTVKSDVCRSCTVDILCGIIMLQNQARMPTRKQCSSLLERTKGTFLDTTKKKKIKGSHEEKLVRW